MHYKYLKAYSYTLLVVTAKNKIYLNILRKNSMMLPHLLTIFNFLINVLILIISDINYFILIKIFWVRPINCFVFVMILVNLTSDNRNLIFSFVSSRFLHFIIYIIFFLSFVVKYKENITEYYFILFYFKVSFNSQYFILHSSINTASLSFHLLFVINYFYKVYLIFTWIMFNYSKR